jgi:UDP-N-acetylglucosamine 4,6-dehydratase
MVTEDDARMTLELDDRYVICPSLYSWSPGHLEQLGAKPVAEGFRYSSDLNTEWLDAASLAVLVARKAA